jgi:hypothetical protein
VTIFAVAMAWVEAAVVFYLRTMFDRIEPFQANPLPLMDGFAQAELVREAATLIMLLAVGVLAGQSLRERLAYSAIAFGVWDIFYYAFLKVLCGWPHSLFDWDILFLIPLPWWGPVLAPVAIALLMILWGSLVVGREIPPVPLVREWKPWCFNFVGIMIALCLFMADAARVSDKGADAVRRVLPVSFNWPLFGVSLLLMAAPVLRLLWGTWRPERASPKSAFQPEQTWPTHSS